MQKFKSHKVVEAARITEVASFFQDLAGPTVLVTLAGEPDPLRISQKVFQRQIDEGTEIVGGYLIRYIDGYTSWSPPHAFEEAYQPLVHDPKNGALPVAGYQPQTDAKVQTVNFNKEAEEATLRILDVLETFPGIDRRWLAIGRTHIEQGWMAVNRAIFLPGRVKLSGDEADGPHPTANPPQS